MKQPKDWPPEPRSVKFRLPAKPRSPWTRATAPPMRPKALRCTLVMYSSRSTVPLHAMKETQVCRCFDARERSGERPKLRCSLVRLPISPAGPRHCPGADILTGCHWRTKGMWGHSFAEVCQADVHRTLTVPATDHDAGKRATNITEQPSGPENPAKKEVLSSSCRVWPGALA